MQVVTPQLIQDKKVLLRLDIDVPLENGEVVDDFRLKAAIPTLELCLQYAESVIVMGHIGRPEGEVVPELSVEPIYNWLAEGLNCEELEDCRLKLLENLRFERGEEALDLDFARQLAALGEVFINEAFAAYHPAASTTILPTLLPSLAGLRLAKEVEVLKGIRENPQKPLVAIIGGAKVEDKLPAAQMMAQIADKVLLGGKLPLEISEKNIQLPENILIGKLNESGTDLDPQTLLDWQGIITEAKMIVWNGPMGLLEESQNDQTKRLAEMIIGCGVESIVGGGDTVSALDRWGMLDKFSFVSTGGGAMLKFLEIGTLPTIEALK